LFVNNVYAEDSIDPSLITPIEKYIVINVIKAEPVITRSNTYLGYELPKKSYDLNSVYVNTYNVVEMDGVYYKKHMFFNNNRWNEILIKE
jgi:hypothetical protein